MLKSVLNSCVPVLKSVQGWAVLKSVFRGRLSHRECVGNHEAMQAAQWSAVTNSQSSAVASALLTSRLHFHWKLYWLCVKDSPGLAVIYSVAELLQLAATLGWRVGHRISSNATVWWHSLECDNAHPRPRVLGVVIIFICRMRWPGPDCAFFSTHWWCDVDIQSLWCWRMLHRCQLHCFFKSGVYSENITPWHLTTGLFFSLHFNLEKINK